MHPSKRNAGGHTEWLLDPYAQTGPWFEWSVQDFKYQVEAFKTSVSLPTGPIDPLVGDSPEGEEMGSDANAGRERRDREKLD